MYNIKARARVNRQIYWSLYLSSRNLAMYLLDLRKTYSKILDNNFFKFFLRKKLINYFIIWYMSKLISCVSPPAAKRYKIQDENWGWTPTRNPLYRLEMAIFFGASSGEFLGNVILNTPFSNVALICSPYDTSQWIFVQTGLRRMTCLYTWRELKSARELAIDTFP